MRTVFIIITRLVKDGTNLSPNLVAFLKETQLKYRADHSGQTKPNQTKPNYKCQTKPYSCRTKPNQIIIKPNQTKLN